MPLRVLAQKQMQGLALWVQPVTRETCSCLLIWAFEFDWHVLKKTTLEMRLHARARAVALEAALGGGGSGVDDTGSCGSASRTASGCDETSACA